MSVTSLLTSSRARLMTSAAGGLSRDAVAGRYPGFLADFAGERYSSQGNGVNTFSSAITHAATTNATMVDSDGLLKWRPHNLVTNTTDFSGWSPFRATFSDVSDGVATFTQDTGETNGGGVIRSLTGVVVGQTIKWVVELKDEGQGYARIITNFGSFRDARINLSTATLISQSSGHSTTVTALEDGWVKVAVEVTIDALTNDDVGVYLLNTDTPSTNTATPDASILLRKPRCYVADLGGTVNNPDTNSDYVPNSTGSALYLPRRGHHVYDGTSWVNEGLLHESEARTNAFTQSNDFSTWSSTNTSVTDNAATGLDGLTSASTVVQASTTAVSHFIYTTASVTSGTTYTFSVFVKYVDWQYVNLDVSDGSFGSSARATFDLTNGVVTDGSNGADTIENWGNGWWRIAMSVPATATNTSSFFVSFNDGSTFDNTFDGDGTSSFIIYGAQLEEGPTPSSYIPTSGSTVERAAETLTIPAANLPWPTPVVIGAELVTNGAFDTDISGWAALFGSISWEAGKLRLTEDGADGGSARAYQGITTEIGKVYRVTADVGAVSFGNAQVVASTNTNVGGFPQVLSSGNETVELIFVAAATTTNIIVGVQGISARTADFDNISVREIDPLAVSLQMNGRVTYADEDTFANVTLWRWQADSSNNLRTTYDTVGTTGNVVFRSSASGVNDFPIGTIEYSPGVLVPLNIASRHGSTFINGAVDGTALTENTTPVALPDLETTDLTLGYDYMGTIKTFRAWAVDLGDTGIESASS